MEAHIKPLVAVARELSSKTGIAFSGLDSSAAPSKDHNPNPRPNPHHPHTNPARPKDVASICRLVELLGVEHFGGSGTLEAVVHWRRVLF